MEGSSPDDVYLLDRFQALLKQEATHYRLKNYIIDPVPHPQHPDLVRFDNESQVFWKDKSVGRQKVVYWIDEGTLM